MRKISVVFTILFLITGFSFAHSLWITLDRYRINPGEKAIYYIGYGHKYLSIEERVVNLQENYQKMFKKVEVYRPDGKKVILIPEKGAGKINADVEGTYVICTESVRKAGEPYGPSGKYAKTILQVGKKTTDPSRNCGFRVEIIPLKNPEEIRPGEYLPVKIIFEGKPLSTFVYATYSGYKPVEDAFPVMTRSNSDGIAKIKISNPGEWMILVSHRVNYSATLTFEVK
ncbi:MAG: DUF4198 domain-containing protein [Candidatus Aminicenantes bacterium]|nr:DUF4198 domain-containing protein [Candidatus Aminicenantes bacterium]